MSEFSKEELAVCIKVLETLNENPSSFSLLSEDVRRKLEINAGKLSRPTRDQKKKRNKEAKKEKKREIVSKEKQIRTNILEERSG